MKHPILSRFVLGFALLAALLSVGLRTTDAEAQGWSGRNRPVFAQRHEMRREVRRQEIRREIRQERRPVVVAPVVAPRFHGRVAPPRGRHGRW